MATMITPVNKQAAIFLSRKKRIETVKEALEKLSAMLLEPQIADNVIQMLQNRAPEESPCLQIKIAIHRDPKTQDMFTVKLSTQISTELSQEGYWGLR